MQNNIRFLLRFLKHHEELYSDYWQNAYPISARIDISMLKKFSERFDTPSKFISSAFFG